MALANTMKLARFANSPLARYDNDLLWHVGQLRGHKRLGCPDFGETCFLQKTFPKAA